MSCVPVLPPRRGSFYVESGTGVSVGSALTFWCREGYQLVGSEKIYCHVWNGKPQWSNYLPVCEGKLGISARFLAPGGSPLLALSNVATVVGFFGIFFFFFLTRAAIPRPEDRGLRVAVLASVVSGIVILAMSLSFVICCLQERSSRDRAKKEGRSRSDWTRGKKKNNFNSYGRANVN